jgi:hypothetical protein
MTESSPHIEHLLQQAKPVFRYQERQRRHEETERQKIERNFAKLRREQSGRGSLINFVRYFWHTLEPQSRKLVEGWPLEAVCLHLEAITFGDITRLLINVPPGFMKSLLSDVFWPAWEWGPMNMPHLRYVAFSYSDTIARRALMASAPKTRRPEHHGFRRFRAFDQHEISAAPQGHGTAGDTCFCPPDVGPDGHFRASMTTMLSMGLASRIWVGTPMYI